MASLGDKIYKSVAFEPGFFKGRGLIPGSTNSLRSVHQRGGAVNFYADINLEKKLNPGSKNYETVVREQSHRDEVNTVRGTRFWERDILAEVDDQYDPDDDSSDEEAIQVRKDREADKLAKEEADRQAKSALGNQKGKK